jgi:hypothetical protein
MQENLSSESDDGKRSRGLLYRLVPVAMQKLRDAFAVPDLIRRHNGDELAAEAALYSAWSSFQSHLGRGEIQDVKDLESLAGHFIRIAYNRWQRSHHRQRHLDDAVKHGTTRASNGERLPRDFVDSCPRPDEQVAEADLKAHVERVVDEVKNEFSGPKQRIIERWLRGLSERHVPSQADIAKELGTSQWTVSRCLSNFLDRAWFLLEARDEH